MNTTEWTINIHGLAKSKGWWDCQLCKAEGCAGCGGTGFYRSIRESFALIHSEASEALEALRKPDDDHICDKCRGQRDVFGTLSCPKCGGDGKAICGSNFHEELTDVRIRVLDFAGFFGVDILPWENVARGQLDHSLDLEPPDCEAAAIDVLHELIVEACRASKFAYVDDFAPNKVMGPALAKVYVYAGDLIGNTQIAKACMLQKFEYNQSRPHRHGKAF